MELLSNRGVIADVDAVIHVAMLQTVVEYQPRERSGGVLIFSKTIVN